MAQDSPTFEWTADALEKHTTFNRLTARGTVRLALRKAGFEPTTVNPDQMLLVLEKVMPHELAARKVEDAPLLCEAMARALEATTLRQRVTPEAPEDAFERIFGMTGP